MKTDLSPAVRKYLKKVSRKLDLPRDMKERVCSDLRTTITARMESGIPEKQIFQELGTPAQVAAEFNEQMKEFACGKHPVRFVCLAAAILSALVLIGKVIIRFLVDDFINGMTRSVGIIGGADGPTSIFVTATVSDGFDGGVWIWILVLILGAAGYYWFSHRHHKEDKT